MFDNTANTAAIELAARLYKASENQNDRERLEADVLREAESYIGAIVRQMLNRQATEDQMQNARIGALKALRSYDPARANYKTWLYQHVRKELFRSTSTTVQLPEYIRCLLLKLQDFEDNYFIDAPPTDEEICSALAITQKQLALVKQAQGISVSGDSDTTKIDDLNGAFEDGYEQAERKADVRAALKRLGEQNPVAQDVALSYFLHGVSIEDTAAQLHIHYYTAQKALSEAVLFLRDELAVYN